MYAICVKIFKGHKKPIVKPPLRWLVKKPDLHVKVLRLEKAFYIVSAFQQTSSANNTRNLASNENN